MKHRLQGYKNDTPSPLWRYAETGCKGRIVRLWLQFFQNLQELTHGVRPGLADILVL